MSSCALCSESVRLFFAFPLREEKQVQITMAISRVTTRSGMTETDEQTARTKAALRQTMKARRAALSAEERQTAGAALAAHGLDFLGPLPAGTVIGGFMPIGEEISPLPLMARLHGVGCTLALPVMMGRAAPLTFRRYVPGDALATVVWGIREPLPDQAVMLPDLVLTALLAFDDQGYRLGYGGGYYDRTIRALRSLKKTITIGVAFDQQRVDAVPHLDYDERLDWIVTPSGALQTTR
jgi:5-formyltetrahydrofolate cyclo-ligase